MSKLSKASRLALFAFGGATLMVLLGFVGSMRSTAICEAIEVKYTRAQTGLVPENQVRDAVVLEGKMPVGMALGAIDTRSIEEALRALPHVNDAVVYKTIDRKMVVEIEERVPILRLIDSKGLGAMLDENGQLLPLSPYVVLRLPVVSGAFTVRPEALKLRSHVADEGLDAALYQCFLYASHISQSDFWKAQLQHTDYTAQREFVAYPQVGNHSILFGDASRLTEKFETLNIFYQQGMDASRWNKYSMINLKFKDQIVCTKK
jgi:cell division protein FtsQ